MRNESKLSSLGTGRVWLVMMFFLASFQSVLGASPFRLATYKHDVIDAFDAELSRVLSDCDANITKAVRHRIAITDQLASDILSDLEALHSDLLGTELDGASGSSAQSPRKALATSRTAAEMADSYFAELADVHKTPGNDIAELQQLEVRRLRAASKCMLEAGKGTVPANDQARREIVEKSSLIALLAVPDEAWSGEDVKALPEWVRRDQNLAMLELLALHIKRPQTAYQVSLHAAVVPANTGTAKETYAQYLSRSAESLKKSHEYDLAVYCLQTGLASFAGRKEPDATAELRCQLATVLDAMGHPELAVEQTQQALADGGVSALRGKLAAMQLMYLYRARRFSDVTKEGPVYMRDPKCEAYMPYVLYVQWLALRSQDEMEQAGKVQREFLSKFASHSLAADMYYASAIDAINQGNLEGASQFLDRVDGLDPNLLWKPKVRSLRESIKQMRQVESK